MNGAAGAKAAATAAATASVTRIKEKQQRAVLQSSTHQQLQAMLLASPPEVTFDISAGMKELQKQIREGLQIKLIRQKIFDTDELQWAKLLQLSIATSDIEVVKKFCEARVNLNVTDTLQGVRFSFFQLAGAVYDNHPNPVALSIMGEIAALSNTAQTLEAFRVFLRYTDVQPDDLQRLGTQIVSGSLYPIIVAIQLADVFYRAGARIISRREQLEQLGSFFTNLAVQLLNSLGSDHIAALALEVRNEQGINAVDVALATNNMDFMTDLQVIRIVTNIWTSSHYLAQTVMVEPGQRGNRPTLHRLLVMSPMQFFHLNKAKFILRTVGFVAFLLSLSATMLDRPQIYESITWLEVQTWIAGTGFVISEISELSRLGPLKYFSSGWNKIDATAWSCLTIAAFWRIISLAFVDGPDTYQQSVYDGLMSFIVVILWVRLTRAFAINSSLGTLTRMLNQFARDIFVFSLLLSVIIVGFGIALCAVVGDEIEGYHSVGGSLFTLYQSALGQFDFSPFQTLGTGKRIVAQSLLGVFLLVSIVVLVNLLVAMMADTYTKVQDRSQKEFLCGWSELTWEIHQETNTLPPPFNLIVYVLALPYVLLKSCQDYTEELSKNPSPKMTSVRGKSLPAIVEQRLSMSIPGSIVAMETVAPEWICGFCWTVNALRSSSENHMMTEKWITKIEGSVPDTLRFIPEGSVSLCTFCKSLKRAITRRQMRIEKISFTIFMAVIWFPASLILVGPQLVEYVLKTAFASLREFVLRLNAVGSKYEAKMAHTNNGQLPDRIRSKEINEHTQRWVGSAIQSLSCKTLE